MSTLTFRLEGLAEGVVGKSFVEANSIDELLEKYPALNSIKEKLTFTDTSLLAIVACDG